LTSKSKQSKLYPIDLHIYQNTSLPHLCSQPLHWAINQHWEAKVWTIRTTQLAMNLKLITNKNAACLHQSIVRLLNASMHTDSPWHEW